MPYVDRQQRVCGFLDIEELENSNKFLRRYFILENETKMLTYYMDNPLNLPSDATPVGSINLQYVSKASDASKQKPKTEFCFVLQSAERRFYLQANDHQDKEQWIEILNNVCKITVPKKSNVEGKFSNISYTMQIVGGVVVKTPVETLQRVEDIHSTKHACSLCKAQRLSIMAFLACQQQQSNIESDSSMSGDEDQKSVNPALSPERPIKTGHCIKQGAKVKNWKTRYFVLDRKGLSYFKSQQEKVPLRTIKSDDIIEARESIGVHPQKNNLFEVVTLNRVFYIQAGTQEEMISWIEKINQTAKKNISKDNHQCCHHVEKRHSSICAGETTVSDAEKTPSDPPEDWKETWSQGVWI